MLAASTLAGCSQEDGNQPAAPAEPSAWETVLAEVQPDGTVTADTALAAFALAVGPVPGATPPAGATEPIDSGTLAVAWVFDHWDDLDEAQREAVLDALEAPTDTGGTGGEVASSIRVEEPQTSRAVATQDGGPANPNIACQTADSADANRFRAWAPDVESTLAARLDRPLGISASTFISVNTVNLESALMYAYACGGTGNEAEGCTIHINPRAVEGLADDALRSALFHEYMHCFMFDRFGRVTYGLPAWWVEGAPSWAMTTLGVRVERIDTWWTRYLDNPTRALTQRTYDGLGFFVHLNETGTDPWGVIDPIAEAMIAGPPATRTASGWGAAGVTDSFLDSWGSGFVRGRYPGAAWTSTGQALPDHQPALPSGSLGNGQNRTIDSLIFAAAVEQVEIHADVVLVQPGAGTAGRITLGGGADALLGAGGPYCTVESCACPEDSPGAGTDFTRMEPGTAYVGLSGGEATGSVALRGMSLPDFCGDPPPDSGQAACVVGQWTSVGVEMRIENVSGAGGAGVAMHIGPTGQLDLDFTGMERINYTASGPDPISGYWFYTGTVSGALALPPAGDSSDTWEHAGDPDYSSLGARVVVTSPFELDLGELSLGELAAAGDVGGAVDTEPVISGRWSCTGDTLTTTAPSGLDVTWTFTRTGPG